MTSFTLVGMDNCLEAQGAVWYIKSQRDLMCICGFLVFFLRNVLSHLHLYCVIIKFRVYLDVKYKYRELSSLFAIA